MSRKNIQPLSIDISSSRNELRARAVSFWLYSLLIYNSPPTNTDRSKAKNSRTLLEVREGDEWGNTRLRKFGVVVIEHFVEFLMMALYRSFQEVKKKS